MKTVFPLTCLFAFLPLSCYSPERDNPLDPVDFVASKQLDVRFDSKTASASLSWEKASDRGFKSYTIFRRIGQDTVETPIWTIPAADDTTFVNIGLEGNTEYTYRVVTRNTVGDEESTNQVSGGFHMFLMEWEVGAGSPVVPFAIDIDKDDNIYVVVDSSGYLEIEKFDSSGKLFLSWPVCRDWPGQGIMGIASDSEGNIYVNWNIAITRDFMYGGIPLLTKFNSDGNFQWKVEIETGPDYGAFTLGVAVDSNDNIFVFDTASVGYDNIHKFDVNGSYLGGYRFREEEWSTIHASGLETWGGFIGIADRDEDRLRIANINGSISAEFPYGIGSRGIMNGQLNDPVGFAVDDSGRFFVLDAGNSRVQVFNGVKYLTKWGSQGDRQGEFNLVSEYYGPRGDIALDSRGNVYVVDSVNKRIQKFGP